MPIAKYNSLQKLPELSFNEAINLSWDICEQVHELHNGGFTHGDLNSTNILIIAEKPTIVMFTDLETLELYDQETAEKDYEDLFFTINTIVRNTKTVPEEKEDEREKSFLLEIQEFTESEESPKEEHFNLLIQKFEDFQQKENSQEKNSDILLTDRSDAVEEFWKPFSNSKTQTPEELKEFIFQTCFELKQETK